MRPHSAPPVSRYPAQRLPEPAVLGLGVYAEAGCSPFMWQNTGLRLSLRAKPPPSVSVSRRSAAAGQVVRNTGYVGQASLLRLVPAQLGGVVPAQAVQHRLPALSGQDPAQILPAQKAVAAGAAPGPVYYFSKIVEQAAIGGL